jgi:Protein of unknown function (DUF3085)
MIRLLFPLVDVLQVAEHAIAAPEHKPSFSNRLDGTTPKAALWFAGDMGLYLMSNGLPAQPHPTDTNRLLVVYAAGYRTSAAKHAVADEIGGDDFCDVLPLLDPLPDGRILHTDLTGGAAAGATHFIIEIDLEHWQFYILAAGNPEATR